MKIGATSDLHGYLPEFPDEQLDLLLVAGDVGVRDGFGLEAFGGFGHRLSDFNHWLKDAGCPVVGIAGNHDRGFEDGRSVADGLNWVYLEDETAVIDGFKIHGSPWTPTFGPWAFMKDDPDLRDHWAMIPDDVDILITHGPPRGFLDVGFGGHHAGSKTLDQRLRDMFPKRPLLHIFGHIHGWRGVTIRAGEEAAIANVSYVAEEYFPYPNGIIVFDVNPSDEGWTIEVDWSTI